jgi:predicted esterase
LRLSILAAALLAGAPTAALATTSVTLPDWACSRPDTVYADAFDAAQAVVPNDPSSGSGGAYPGAITRSVHVAGLGIGTQNYYVYVPADYTPARTWPLLLALHGVAPLGSADSYAETTRDNWAQIAAAAGFIVAAPVADKVIYSNGTYAVSWLVPPSAGATDYDLFAAVRADLESAYNIERTRIYGWGFSAGGHVMHDLGVNQYSTAFNAATMAAYGVSGGDLAGLACVGYTDAGCTSLLNSLPRRIPVDIHVGNTDPNYAAAANDHTRFLAAGWADAATVYYTVFAGGHTYTIEQLGQVWSNLCPNAVTP